MNKIYERDIRFLNMTIGKIGFTATTLSTIAVTVVLKHVNYLLIRCISSYLVFSNYSTLSSITAYNFRRANPCVLILSHISILEHTHIK